MILYETPLRIELEGERLIVNGQMHARDIRKSSDMADVLYDSRLKEDFDAYFMFREVYSSGSIRFDITVIPARMLGPECAKTFGHYHPKAPGGIHYPEAYQVLKGNAMFILQKNMPDGRVQVLLVDAKQGETVLVPPGYGHVTVNKGQETLVLSNLVYSGFESVYSEYRESRGAAYYYLKDGEIVQNSNYIVEKNEQLRPEELNKRYGFQSKDLLEEFYKEPAKFAFLEKPGLLSK